ncbi:hypothetical protein ABIB75_007470 [Bradyrhizobium sp. GM2.2]
MNPSVHFIIRSVVLAAAVLVGVGGGPTFARDHDDARRAVEAGEIRPLAEILNVVKGKLPGEVVGVKPEREAGAWLYEFRVVDVKGRVFEIHVDAKSGELERTKHSRRRTSEVREPFRRRFVPTVRQDRWHRHGPALRERASARITAVPR